ncbi:phage major capsid protein [Desulfallas thermosapovorans]|uniref:HK97 family phage major capsid protein n=1 Tax=Desulfallas thermosapovorans DSM 6562 TaxID=1121431 RepID=A0A5S4ZVM4_9FIRM|nr:phage major capsid protein [Desulfallas thermosapovorans]TYO97041.1 HK97 family phage major capsid protein [Desulfallas thermosapovorans DSM 6562]
MTIEQMRARMGEIAREMRDLHEAAEYRTFNSFEQREWDDLLAEFNRLKGKVDAAMRVKPSAPFRTLGEVEDWCNQRQNSPIYQDTLSGSGEFRNLGEFLETVRFSPGDLRTMSAGVGSAGGFLVPQQFRDDILKISPEAAIVRPRATIIEPGSAPDASITIPALVQGNEGVFGGVTVQWIAEGDPIPETEPELGTVTLTPKEVAAHVVVTDKLLRNSEAASQLITELLRNAVAAAEDYAFLRGNGVGKPAGVLNCPGRIIVNRQQAGNIQYTDIVNMLSRILPDSWSSAVWIASITTLPQLVTLQDPAGRYIFIQGDASKGIPSTLAGIPIRFNGRVPTIANEGCLMLSDLRYYLIKDGSGPFVMASEHVRFIENKTVIRIFWNVDGAGWVTEPLLLEDGETTVSPFVCLR